MSLFSIPPRKHTAYYDHLMSSSKTPDSSRQAYVKAKDITLNKSETLSGNATCDDSRSVDKSREINRTYVISAVSRGAGQQVRGNGTPVASGRLTLQRRNTGSENAKKTMSENTQTTTPAPEKRLTLQRRTRTGSIDKSASSDISKVTKQDSVDRTEQPKVLVESSNRTPGSIGVFRSNSLRETATRPKAKDFTVPLTTPAKGVDRPGRHVQNKTPSSSRKPPQDTVKPEEQIKTFSTPNRKTQFEKITAKKDVFEKLAGKEVVPRAVAVKSASLERPKVQHQAAEQTPVVAQRGHKAQAVLLKPNASLPPTQVRKTSTTTSSTKNGDVNLAGTSSSATTSTTPAESLVRPSEVVRQQQALKMENSAVTVAVRVRPFSAREKTEKALQVIFMNNQETVVQHPDTKQSYSFIYDFSFCSVDENNSNFASQQTVYEGLAKPLLEKAFEGFNTCLFAYGQTGSGKSYTMMGFGEEEGVIPRFCQELFSRLASTENKEVTCHLEMSYFEVYNEKIHDLLIARDEQVQKRVPLRVREHPVHGPYVAELSANVVSSYSDIQGWLELGNKQRATAATGMNDKSSRSHSVFTLVMTQTKTECVEGEEHDHRITSRINLVDLAGSERCLSAQTSGDRLREGASINKSLLTLGRVISALSEQAQTRRAVFTPYRESVLTWLLKESLGGNSKTAMIATLSPACSNVEESLSTLRYARQARMIINLAKVNEDNNAKLIRELKAEVEKLRAAQMSSQGVKPEEMRMFQQEISALRNKLMQQEREMVEANRVWREKLEQAEIRKREETKELQRAGVTFKVDNRLPNLVNLNEDPQLSEMLLYMIKEGQTRVGQQKSETAHDIQLTGALIADQHCIISNVSGTVSIAPVDTAKTFVNGNLISEATVLQHGDRVILGGDHYFRFNHPAEVQSGKRVSCWTGSGDGQKDFEYAKNELLSAQRAQLEAEIEAARVKAKEEMMQGILMAKQVAQKEMSEQKMVYEDRIRALEKELEEECGRQRLQQEEQQRVASQVEQLQVAKLELQQEVDTHKTRLRLHIEAQAMEEHTVRQAKIVEALEAEKMKLSKDLEEMQARRALRENRPTKAVPQQWDALKLSLMIEEANKISVKLRKNAVFSRHEGSDKENMGGNGEVQVQVQNTKLGISTFWSLEKFQNNMAAMRELDQGDPACKDDDVFYDPNDDWEQDLSASSSSSSTAFSFSRRRSRSLLKGRRISGRLYEIRVHPIQSLHNASSQNSGLMGVSKPPSIHLSSADSAMPGICKDMIGQAVAQLRGFGTTEESLADRLRADLCLVYTAVRTISDLYDSLDDNSQEKVFVCNTEAQTQLLKATSAINAAVLVTTQWLASIKATSGLLYATAEELKTQVKKMGGFFQLLIQGCDSEISSMVTEAQRKTGKCLDASLKALGHLAAVTGTPLRVTEPGAQATGKLSVATSLLEGTNQGVRALLEEGLRACKEMLREAQLAYARTPAMQSLKSQMLDLACALQSYIHCTMTEWEASQEKVLEAEGETDASCLLRLRSTAAKLVHLNQAIRQLHCSLARALQDKGCESNLYIHRDSVHSFVKAIDEVINSPPKVSSSGLQMPCLQSVLAPRDKLQSALQSLLSMFDQQETLERSRGSANSTHNTEDGDKESVTTLNTYKSRTVPKRIVTLSNGDPCWV